MAARATRALLLMREFAHSRITQGRFDTAVMSKAQIIGGSEGHVKCEIPVTEELLNGIGTLHGGAIATIIDCVSTWACVSVGNNVPGVSVDLSISYMKTALPGETVVAEAKASHVGKRLAFFTVDIKSKDSGIMLAQGKHTKYVSGPASAASSQDKQQG